MNNDMIAPNITAHAKGVGPHAEDWQAFEREVALEAQSLQAPTVVSKLWYEHDNQKQGLTPSRFVAQYEVPVPVYRWVPSGQAHRAKPPLICLGGIASNAVRFNYLAHAVHAEQTVVTMDWVGRGHSGWLRDGEDYTLQTCVDQVIQLIDWLDAPSVILLGSSWGGTVAMHVAEQRAARVNGLILNDIGPELGPERRMRRAQTLCRHYVFRCPRELLLKTGVSQKHDGPLPERVRQYLAYYGTRWSEQEQGRVYLHDPRAMQAYKEQSRQPLDTWTQWNNLRCPTLLLHGQDSDVLTPDLLSRMQRSRQFDVAHFPHTGHTPSLCHADQMAIITQWLLHHHSHKRSTVVNT